MNNSAAPSRPSRPQPAREAPSAASSTPVVSPFHGANVAGALSQQATHSDAEAPRELRLLRRRAFLLRGAGLAGVLATGGALSACGTDASGLGKRLGLGREPEPNPVLLQLRDVLSSSAASQEGRKAAFLKAQAERVGAEVLRQCGSDDAGNPATTCSDSLASPGATDKPTVKDADISAVYLTALLSPRAAAPEVAFSRVSPEGDTPSAMVSAEEFVSQAHLATGLFAAWATTLDIDSPILAEVLNLSELEKADFSDIGGSLSAGARKGETAAGLSQLAVLVELCYACIFASGLALAGIERSAANSGARGVVQAMATRARALRDGASEILRSQSAEIPTAEASYALPRGTSTPTNQAEALELFLACLSPITQQLRLLVQTSAEAHRGTDLSASAPTRDYLARWCALFARGEAACESLLGQDPLRTIVRGGQEA